MAEFLHLYLLAATALIAVILLGFLVYDQVLWRLGLVVTFLRGAGGERRHLAILDLKLRALRWLAATAARYEQERSARRGR